MRTVMCFGDSNTWGFDIEAYLRVGQRYRTRFAPELRWPGVLAARLGSGWRVIEEGLNGRTTAFDDAVEGKHRNGSRYLQACLESQAPLDIVTIMLGTNDLKSRFSLPAGDIAAAAGNLARTVLSSQAGHEGRPPAVLLIAPFPLGEAIRQSPFGEMFGWERGVAESKLLGDRYRAQAELFGIPFLDAGSVVEAHPLDCIHLSAADQAKLGEAVAGKLLEWAKAG